MIPVVAMGAVVLASVAAFLSPTWCWAPIALVDSFVIYVYVGMRRHHFTQPDGISPTAQELFVKFAHFYADPFGGAAFSSASSTLAIGGVLPGVIGWLRGSSVALAIAVLNYLLMAWIGWHFNPMRVLRTATERAAHDELLSRLHSPTGSASPTMRP